MRVTGSGWIVVASAAIVWPAAPTTTAADAVGPSRAELMHRWDLNRDGTIDESEAEVARANMRRARLELQQKTATEKPLVPEVTPGDTSMAPQRRDPLEPLKTGQADGDPLGEAFRLLKPSAPKADGGDAVRDPSGPNRDLNAGRPMNDGRRGPNAQSPRATGPLGTGSMGKGATGGVVTGGVRAGAPALRPGYGASGPKIDLNAGRLPAGLPPAQGMRPQIGSAPFRGGLPGIGPDRASNRGIDPRGTASRPLGTEPARPPLLPSSPNRVTAEDIGLP